MNNEPVAWMNIHGQFNKKETWLFPIPLYTHPIKELTDETIITVADPLNLWNVPKDKLIEFARAILRKAKRNE